jgi:hypothetical protein
LGGIHISVLPSYKSEERNAAPSMYTENRASIRGLWTSNTDTELVLLKQNNQIRENLPVKMIYSKV